MTIDLQSFDAFAVDLDGVVTNTAVVHAEAWRKLFDEILRDRAHGGTWIPFDLDQDYRRYVDGRPRRDGLRGFLASRGIEIPEGQPEDGADVVTICGLGARKNSYVHDHLATHGVEVYVDAIAFLRRARAARTKLAIVTASTNCPAVLAAGRLTELFDAQVDGNEIARSGMRGKPAPDTFLEAARRMGTAPRRTVALDDAIAGVEAARAGGFGLVIGVDRVGDGSELCKHGAHIAVHDLGEIELSRGQPQMAAP